MSEMFLNQSQILSSRAFVPYLIGHYGYFGVIKRHKMPKAFAHFLLISPKWSNRPKAQKFGHLKSKRKLYCEGHPTGSVERKVGDVPTRKKRWFDNNHACDIRT